MKPGMRTEGTRATEPNAAEGQGTYMHEIYAVENDEAIVVNEVAASHDNFYGLIMATDDGTTFLDYKDSEVISLTPDPCGLNLAVEYSNIEYAVSTNVDAAEGQGTYMHEVYVVENDEAIVQNEVATSHDNFYDSIIASDGTALSDIKDFEVISLTPDPCGLNLAVEYSNIEYAISTNVNAAEGQGTYMHEVYTIENDEVIVLNEVAAAEDQLTYMNEEYVVENEEAIMLNELDAVEDHVIYMKEDYVVENDEGFVLNVVNVAENNLIYMKEHYVVENEEAIVLNEEDAADDHVIYMKEDYAVENEKAFVPKCGECCRGPCNLYEGALCCRERRSFCVERGE